MGMADKAIAALVVVSLFAGAGWLFNHQIKARIHAENKATAYELARDQAVIERDKIKQDLVDEQRRSMVLDDELQLARTENMEAVAVLADRNRLFELTQRKPGLLEIKAKKATTRVWETIEAEANAPL